VDLCTGYTRFVAESNRKRKRPCPQNREGMAFCCALGGDGGESNFSANTVIPATKDRSIELLPKDGHPVPSDAPGFGMEIDPNR
jgi:hypothetical protein